MERTLPRFSLVAVTSTLTISLFLVLPAFAQGELEVSVAKKVYTLPAIGEVLDADAEALPVSAETLAAIQTWRVFAWDARKREYRYRFAVAPETGAAIALTPDASARELAGYLDRAAGLVSEYIGPGNLEHDYVSIVCRTQKELERAVDFTADIVLARADESSVHAYVDVDWRKNAKKNPTFFLSYSGTVGCIEGNSEKWSPAHEIVRGFAQVSLTRHAEQLSHINPILVGLTWNIECDVLGDILSIPFLEGFQFDIGRGKWSSSAIAKVLKSVGKAVQKEHQRELALRDFPYLGHADGLPEKSASLAWAVSCHLARHHSAQLGVALTAMSERVVELHTETDAAGATKFWLEPTYQLPWNEIGAVLETTLEDYDFAALSECITSRCKTCKSYAKERGIN